jgi:hypothetical protein
MCDRLANNSVLILRAVCAHGCSDEGAVVLAEVSRAVQAVFILDGILTVAHVIADQVAKFDESVSRGSIGDAHIREPLDIAIIGAVGSRHRHLDGHRDHHRTPHIYRELGFGHLLDHGRGIRPKPVQLNISLCE